VYEYKFFLHVMDSVWWCTTYVKHRRHLLCPCGYAASLACFESRRPVRSSVCFKHRSKWA